MNRFKRKLSTLRSGGGRATATGVGYEAQVAAFIAVKMLGGAQCAVWDGVNGGDIAAITMQDIESVDDVVVTLNGEHSSKVYISAKHRASAIALTSKSSAFVEVITAFIRQFLKIAEPMRAQSRLVWAIPSTAGVNMSQHLLKVLNIFRDDVSVSLADFLKRRPINQAEAFKALLTQSKKAWVSLTERVPSERELREFLRMIHVEVFDFSVGQRHEQNAEDTIRSLIAEQPAEAPQIWGELQLHFMRANREGIRTDAKALRQVLAVAGLKLKAPRSFAEDIEFLKQLTARNLVRLKEHTLLRFEKNKVHIERAEEQAAMIEAVMRGHLLITGEPGCGKSGLLYPLADSLSQKGIPVVLLLAEEVFDHDCRNATNLPGLVHSLDDVLTNWPNGASGVIITDALDAVRDVETQKSLRRLLNLVQQGHSHWTVVASVREFDLKYGRELREAFSGDGAPGHSSKDFAGVSHFHVERLSESMLDTLSARIPKISPFIISARKNPRAGGMHRSPFFLRLAAELLSDGVSSSRLADWNSPAILLRKFWNSRMIDGAGAHHRQAALQSICRRMTQLRALSIAIQDVSLSASELDAIKELRSRGILQTLVLKHGIPTGDDELRFSHHLLHDYAVVRSLIPATATRFAGFVMENPLMPIFYRQSFIFALEELWDGPDGSSGFWRCALKMEEVPKLHGVTRILAPILASQRIDQSADLDPLLSAVQSSQNENSPAEKALRHMASGLHDTDPDLIRAGATAWSSFVARLSALLSNKPSLETPITHILARLNSVCDSFEAPALPHLNSAACALLAHHVTKEVPDGWRYAAHTAIEGICRTFKIAPLESESALLALLAPNRLIHFPHDDLFDFAHKLKHLGAEADSVVVRLFDAAFATEPEAGQWQEFGSSILPMRMQSSDNWNSIHYSLAEYYAERNGANAGVMTDVACIAWNATVRRRFGQRDSRELHLGTFSFFGARCDLFEDSGHVWNREHENEENRILTHFESLLNTWAESGDELRLRSAITSLVEKNKTSLLWTIFLETGAKYPATLGSLLEPVIDESLFLTHPDYCDGGTLLLSSLHNTGDASQRSRLEKLILDLPRTARFFHDEPREPMPGWLENAQNRLLGSLNEVNIVLPNIRKLRSQRMGVDALPINQELRRDRATGRAMTEDTVQIWSGVNKHDPVAVKLLGLRDALAPFRAQDGKAIEVSVIEQHWTVLNRCEVALRLHRVKYPKHSDELWGHLVSACEGIARHANWPAKNKKWKTIRRILLRASSDPLPRASKDDATEDKHMSWGWPAPRLDAARGLMLFVYRIGRADREIAEILRRLVQDKSIPLRFNLASQLTCLNQAEPELMWEIIDQFIEHESRFAVLEPVVLALNRLWGVSESAVRIRLSRIVSRANRDAPAEHEIHEHLAHTHLFYFLRTGDKACETFIDALIGECDRHKVYHVFGAQLHNTRKGGWLTAGDAMGAKPFDDSVRKRSWRFVGDLMQSAQRKLIQHRELVQKLHSEGQAASEEMKSAQESMKRAFILVDRISMELYFASGAYAEKKTTDEDSLTEPQKHRFWRESSSVFQMLAEESHPHTIHHVVQTLHHLLPCEPQKVFITAARAIISSAKAGYHQESLAVGDVVKLIQRALADHREIFQNSDGSESECLAVLLSILDIFVEAGWPEARQLTHRLEEIYR